MLNLAQVAFTAYRESRCGIAYDGTIIPVWDSLTPGIKAAWAAAAHAVLRAASDSFMNGTTGQVYISDGTPPYRDIANDLARQTLDLPPDCDRLTVQDIAATPRPPTRDELRAANEKALDDIAAFASGKLEIHY